MEAVASGPRAASPLCPQPRAIEWGAGLLSRGALSGKKAGPRSVLRINRAHSNASTRQAAEPLSTVRAERKAP
jgi:hypothetical protein